MGTSLLGLALGVAQAGTIDVLVLDKDGKPAPDAVVVIVPAGKGIARQAPPLVAVVNQEKMQFLPAVTVVSPGAKVRFVNNDAWDHHVRMSAPGVAFAGTTSNADGFALRLEGKSEGKPPNSAEVTLEKPGIAGASLLGCFIHGSMRGHIYVAESSWAVKTGADGVAILEDVPEGAAMVKVWHPALLSEKKPQPLTVAAGASKLTVQLDVVPRRRRI
ncbi:MAG: plastocyanin [Rhodoferax sp.]|nr:plastocyanin [Rhodoferax sp.]